tara:strand:+ start:757 stop:1317 length:561 start_codon:yes stop_codon:yes gene_type:complete
MHLLNLIRSKTGAQHTALHTHPLLIHLTSKTITHEIFTEIMTRFYGFHTGITNELKVNKFCQPYDDLFASTIDHLERDLALLQISLEDVAIYKPHKDLNTQEALWAYLYLLLGSSLGGKVIHKSLIENLSTYTSEYTFFQTSSNAPCTWKDFIVMLDKKTLNLNHEEIAAIAQNLFSGLYEWMENK